MANWTSINDVMRDLSVAQGSIVPASLEIYGNSPPNLYIEEDSEYDLKSQGDVKITTKAPDFTFIQEMISMVSDKENKSKLKDCSRSKNPPSPEFVSQKKCEIEPLWRNKVCRNVALQSILAKLDQSTEKTSISKSPSSMFQKKLVVGVEKKSTILVVKPGSDISKCKYIPSVIANEYYNKYMENNKLRPPNKKDIVEPVREIYVRSEPSSEKKFVEYYSSLYCNEESIEKGADVTLERHRHLSLENIKDCIVCNVVKKHGYRFKEENINIGQCGDGFILKHVTTPSLSDDNGTEDRIL